jgi:hypothetical protein
MTVRQLNLDGGEELVDDGRYLSPAQHEILRVLAAGENLITTLRAGRITHQMRATPCERCADPTAKCAFVATDGRWALERLEQRGLVHNIAGALWGPGA